MEFSNFFKSALKYNAPLSIVAVMMLLLLKPVFNNVEFISDNPIVSLIIFLAIVNFGIFALLITRNKNKLITGIKDNKINGNKAKSIKITTEGNIQNNEIKNNEADGKLLIGQSYKNGRS